MARTDTDDLGGLVVALKMFSGLYKRVGIKVGVDPTFVCRVACGERKSPEVSDAIVAELRIIRDYLNRTEHKSNGV
jgi:hypothetical protein